MDWPSTSGGPVSELHCASLLTGTSNDSFLLKMKSHICVRLGDRGYSRQRFSSLQTQRRPRCREKNSASPRPLRFMTSDREPLLLEPQRAPMKALPSNARLKLMSNPQNALQSNYPVASPRKMNGQSPGATPVNELKDDNCIVGFSLPQKFSYTVFSVL